MYEVKPPIEDVLLHYGVGPDDNPPGRGSGRYPKGSGENPYQHADDFLSTIDKMLKDNITYTDEEGKFGPKGKTYTGDTAVAHALGYSSTQFRVERAIAVQEERMKKVNEAQRLYEEGYGYTEIARRMGLKNESSARSLLNGQSKMNTLKAQETADFLKQRIEETGKPIDIGEGVENELGISKNKLAEAVYILEREGYIQSSGRMPNPTDPSGQHMTTRKILGPPGTPKNAVYNYDGVATIVDYISRDNGDSYEKKFHYPESMDSNRLAIRYAEDGGIDRDGLIEIRRGVPDLSLGESTYSQVRILVDGNKYIKGMAIYSDDIPDGVDVVFNTNKTKDKSKLEVLKDIKNDPDNPFGSTIKPEEEGGQYWYEDSNGNKKLGLINKTRHEGDWSEWKDKVPSQFLSKQPIKLAERQLNLAITDKKKELEDIMHLDNESLKKDLLISYANDCDSAAVTLQAAALPRQKHQVIIPINTMKDNEVYAPNYQDGEKVALIRYPHGGTFEIPILTVNNKQKDAINLLGKHPKDAVGINSKVAAQLSGADFDGDTVMVIPTNDKIKVQNKSPLKELEGFDPKTEYGSTKKVIDGKEYYYNSSGKRFKPMTRTNLEMGIISNLITDMTIKGATDEELARAVKHSMVVIDAEKHKLDYRSSEKVNGIKDLKDKYQGHYDAEGKWVHGASTLISRAKAEVDIPKRQGSPRVNIKGTDIYDETRPEGSLIYKTNPKNDYIHVKDPVTKKWVSGYIDKDTGKLTYNKGKETYIGEDGKEHKKYIDVTTEKVKNKIRTQKEEQMSLTDDARSLISDYNSPMEQLYAKYANTMKSLANQARKESFYTKEMKRNPSAVKVYDKEVKELRKSIDIARKNKPRERQAQAIANSRINAKKKSNPDMTKDEIKKLSQRELERARNEVGAERILIDISGKQWEAIQAGAVSPSMLHEIFNHSDLDKIRELATPRQYKEVSESNINRMKNMRQNGYTNSEIANALGVSASTVSKYLDPKKKG